MTKAIQKFDLADADKFNKATPDQIIQFLENFRKLHIEETNSEIDQRPEKLKLISLKISPSLLVQFREKCEISGTPYQTKIKSLMKDWLKN